MPRKIAGIEMITMDALIDAIRMPRVAADSATHLYGRCRMVKGPPIVSCPILTIGRRPGAGFLLDRQISLRPQRGGRPVPYADPLEDVGEVCFDGTFADTQPARDLLVREAFADE